MQNHPVEGFKPGVALKAATKALVVRELLLAEAARRGIVAVAQEREGKREDEDEAKIRALIESEIDERFYDDEAVDREYELRKEKFRAPTLYGLSHILFAGEDAQEKAQVALSEIEKNPSRFVAIARANSDCASKDNGGYLGQMTELDFVPEIRDALPDLEIGKVHPALVLSRYGVHILRLDQKVTGEILPKSYAFKIARENLEKLAWVTASRKLLDQLTRDAKVEGFEFH